MPLGLYISVPFCRTKCTFCNFASDVFSRARFDAYVARVEQDIEQADETAATMGGEFQSSVDTIYLGGGTPTVLEPDQLERIFAALRRKFQVAPAAEITVECAPGTLTEPILAALLRCGVNRVSLGVQSFVDQEARSVGRLHTRDITLRDIERLRAAGIENLSIDLIAGLPHQTADSWRYSLDETIATGVPHVSVYMLEIDDDSRLGRELIAGGTRYHAHHVPDEELTADLYVTACDRLSLAGVEQYEISNFARVRWESRHNLKYWTRQPYFGFGVDAHSMLWADPDPMTLMRAVSEAQTARNPALSPLRVLQDAPLETGGSRPCMVTEADVDAVRFSTCDSLDRYVAGAPLEHTFVSRSQALEEEFFLGLRLVQGIDPRRLAARYGPHAIPAAVIDGCVSEGLLELGGPAGTRLRLTPRGRLLSNEVFERFLGETPVSSGRVG